MEIRRFTDPAIIKHLAPFFTEDRAFTRDIIANEFIEIMLAIPNEIFVVVVFDKEDLYGFAISWLMKDRGYIWLAQAYSKSGNDPSYKKKVFDMMKNWAIETHNIHEIRFETEHNTKAIERISDFKVHGYIMNWKF